jgi:hypothetical protein
MLTINKVKHHFKYNQPHRFHLVGTGFTPDDCKVRLTEVLSKVIWSAPAIDLGSSTSELLVFDSTPKHARSGSKNKAEREGDQKQQAKSNGKRNGDGQLVITVTNDPSGTPSTEATVLPCTYGS